MSGQYSYARRLDKHRLTLRFVRVRSVEERDQNSDSASDVLQQLRDTEFYFVMDEAELRGELGIGPSDGILDSFYSISDFRIDGITTKIEKVHRSDIEYVVRVPNNVRSDQEVHISYTIAFPLSYTDYFFSNLQLPTYGNEITLEYGALESTLWVDGVEAFSAMESAMFSDDREKGKLHVSHSGWAMPRSGVMFVWGRV